MISLTLRQLGLVAGITAVALWSGCFSAASDGKRGGTAGANAGAGGTGTSASAPFSVMYSAEIEYDCQESVQCLEADTATADSTPNCVSATVDALEGNAQKQQEFLQSFDVCRCFRSCDYVNCAGRPTLSYGDTQIEGIRSVCEAKVVCSTTQGGSLTSCTCEQEWIQRLNVAVPAQRDAWEGALTMCAGMSGCLYADCFDAAYGVTNR